MVKIYCPPNVRPIFARALVQHPQSAALLRQTLATDSKIGSHSDAASGQSASNDKASQPEAAEKKTDGDRVEKKKKSVAQLDQELMAKMQRLAGDGGEAGVEYEDGKPVAMKRSVKNNMFRYI